MAELREADLKPNPLEQFRLWFEEAKQAALPEPEAMVLACALPDGTVSARTVLLKELSPDGFIFFTNYQSNKAQALEKNSKVALVFLWSALEKQVRVEGVARKVSPEKSDQYYSSRPRGSQLGAHASPQSQLIKDRKQLEDMFAQVEQRFRGVEAPPRPAHWGGYCVKPMRIEFWQGRDNRLADRLLYTLDASGSWLISRLAP